MGRKTKETRKTTVAYWTQWMRTIYLKDETFLIFTNIGRIWQWVSVGSKSSQSGWVRWRQEPFQIGFDAGARQGFELLLILLTCVGERASSSIFSSLSFPAILPLSLKWILTWRVENNYLLSPRVLPKGIDGGSWTKHLLTDVTWSTQSWI